MPLSKNILITALSLPFGFCVAQAGPYSTPTDTNHLIDPAVHNTSERLVGWAETMVDYSPSPGVSDSFAKPENALGQYSSSIVSLGDVSADGLASGTKPGSITLGFGNGFSNGAGWDFAIFENGFTNPQNSNQLFMELAYVEVSSNGEDFARFDSISTNTGPVSGSGAFAYYDTTNVYNLAGKHGAGYGTTFDLDDLLGHELVLLGLLDLDAIRFVRIVDIPGNGSQLDSEGNPIYDNWLTTGSGGFDLAAIGYAYAAVPEPAHIALLLAAVSFCVIRARRRRPQAA